MKKSRMTDELRPEYDFSKLTGSVRGKYAAAYRLPVEDESQLGHGADEITAGDNGNPAHKQTT